MATRKPDLTRVWANGAPPANVVDPDTTTPGKVNAGWQAEVPPFEHFNFLQKWFTQGLAHFNEQGIGVWDTETTYPINGLAKGSDGNIYKCILEQSGNNPVSDGGANWELLQLFPKEEILGYASSLNTNSARYIIDNPSILFGVQSFCLSANDNNSIYVMSLSSDASGSLSTVYRYSRESRMVTPLDESVGSGTILGHQGLVCVNELGQDRLYSTSYADKRDVVSAIYAAGGEFTSVSSFTAFDSSFSSSLSCTPSESRDGESYIVQGSKSGNRHVREFRISDNRLLSETLYAESELNGKPVQGMAIDKSTIYVIAGDNKLARDKVFLKIERGTGKILYKDIQYGAFFEQAKNVGSSVYEPEGMGWLDGDLCIGMITGVASTNRRTAIMNLTSPSNEAVSASLLGNLLSSVESTGQSGREFLAIRAGKDLTEGGGINVYGSSDPSNRTVVIFDNDGSGNSVASFGPRFIEGPASNRFGLVSNEEARLESSGGNTIRFLTDGATSMSLLPDAMVWFTQTIARPSNDNFMDIGDGFRRIKTIHLVNAPSVTSDINLKQNIRPIEDRILDAWEKVNWKVFKLRQSVESKGEDKARNHFGVIAQEVVEAFSNEGLDAFDYALIRKVEWHYQPEEYEERENYELKDTYDEKGNKLGMMRVLVGTEKVKISDEVEAGERLEIVYEEALSLESALLRRGLRNVQTK